jgi:hypothetical protein
LSGDVAIAGGSETPRLSRAARSPSACDPPVVDGPATPKLTYRYLPCQGWRPPAGPAWFDSCLLALAGPPRYIGGWLTAHYGAPSCV